MVKQPPGVNTVDRGAAAKKTATTLRFPRFREPDTLDSMMSGFGSIGGPATSVTRRAGHGPVPPGRLAIACLAVGAAVAVAGGAGCRPEAPPVPEAPFESSTGETAVLTEARERMVALLRTPGYGIRDERVLAAMQRIPRHRFVPAAVRGSAYADSPLPIGHGQTISQPFIVAFMTEALEPEPTDRVLEIGTGSGYQAAVLAALVEHVFTIEIVEPLANRAAETIERLGIANVSVRHGDGYQGWKEQAPFDAIIVTCAPDAVPRPLVEQLAEGGRMIIPVGDVVQNLHLLEKRHGEIRERAVLPVRFVPMTGEAEGR